MQKSTFSTGLCVLAMIAFVFTSAAAAQESVRLKEIKSGRWKGREIKYVEREIAIKLKAGISENEIRSILALHKAKIKQDFDELRWGWIELPEGVDIFPVISALESMPMVEKVEPNLVGQAASEPNDPYYTDGHQWALKNTGQSPPGGTNGADIHAVQAWDVTTGSSNVIIAILDSGIPMQNGSLSHPDLSDPNRIILGPDYVDDGEGVRDLYGHGTHVAGIAAAQANNDTGIAGVAWSCKLLIIQVARDDGQ